MLRRPTDEKNAADWFAFAEERLRAADTLWKCEGLTAAGIEMLQEAAERYLKGYLIAKGWSLIRTHDLTKLIHDTLPYSPGFADFYPLAEELTRDFFAQHYPGGDMTGVGENYELLRQQTGDLVALIQKSLPQFFPTLNPQSTTRNP